MVSSEVVTAAPVEAAEWPLAAIELVARFRAESAAIVAAVLAGPGRGHVVAGGNSRLLDAGRIGAGRRNVNLVERARILPVARRDLHDDVILVERIVDGRDLTLAEGVVKRVVDRADGETKPHRGVAIDREVGLEAAELLIGVDVLDDVAPHQRLGQLGRPGVEFLRARRRAAYIGRPRCSAVRRFSGPRPRT